MVKKGLKGKLALKIFVPFVLLFVILISVLTAGNINFVFEKVESILEKKAEKSLEIAIHVYERHIDDVSSAAKKIAAVPGLVKAVRTLDRAKMAEILRTGMMEEIESLRLLDRKGRIIADALEPDRSGRDLSDDMIVKHVLEGREIIGMAKTESGLVIVAALPIKERGNVIGVIWISHIFWAHYGKEIETLIGEPVFIFKEDAVINPSFILEQGQEIDVPAKIKNAVLEKGKDYIHTVFIGRKEYSGAFSPLLDFDGNVIGMIMVAIDKGPLFEIFSGITHTALKSSLTGVFVLGLIGFFIARGVTRPVRQLMEMTRKVAKGDLSAKVRVKSSDEIGLLADSFDKMIGDLKASRDELISAKEYTEDIINNVPEIIYSTDGKMRITYMSPKCEEVFGYAADEFKEDPELLAKVIHPDDGTCLKTILDKIFKGEKYEHEYRIVTKEGALRWVRDKGIPQLDSEGNLKRLNGSISDITDSKHAELELKAFAVKLEKSNRELEQFAFVASHDLQEPLRKVMAFGDRLKTKYAGSIGDQGKDYLERMQSASGRMQTLINDLLTYSRVTTKARPFAPVDLSGVVRDVLSDLELRIEQTGGRVEGVDLPTIDADPLQMRQLLQNLIGNALKFKRNDEPPVVKVYGKYIHGSGNSPDYNVSDKELCKIAVEDNGIGFDEKYADRIFGVFQRLHGRSEYEGTGIGLSVCKKIVERHDGSITAKSAPGQGATFIVTLPVKQTKGESTNG